MSGLFITGGGGFIGSSVLRQLTQSSVQTVTVLVHRRWSAGDLVLPRDWQVVEGDVLDPASYEAALPPAGTVLHLAGATGRATAQEHYEVNVTGTQRLVDAARRKGVWRFVYVSSIAARFTDIRWYPYAAAKRAAEEVVSASGLAFTIVRPTMVFGPGSPVQEGLRKMATAPVSFVFGSGRNRVQPVHVDDLAQRLIEISTAEQVSNRGTVVEAGGPEVIELVELLRRMRRASGRRVGRTYGLAAGPVRRMLAAVEAVIGPRLPLSAGQLASFINDGTARPMTPPMANRVALEEMIAG